MSRPNLAQLTIESAKKAEEERTLNNQVARIAAIVTPKIIAAKKAETSKPMSCPHCGELLPDSWRTDDVKSDTENDDDPDNEQEDDDDDDDDDDDRELDAKAKSRIVAELLARKRRR
jgi:hypothetical protein